MQPAESHVCWVLHQQALTSSLSLQYSLLMVGGTMVKSHPAWEQGQLSLDLHVISCFGMAQEASCNSEDVSEQC